MDLLKSDVTTSTTLKNPAVLTNRFIISTCEVEVTGDPVKFPDVRLN